MDVIPAHSEIASLIRQRRTVHDFTTEIPPLELIMQAIELARWAPNHKLTQPWRFRLIGPETKAAIVELNAKLIQETKGEEAAQHKRVRWFAVPGWLAISSIKSDDPIRDQENYASVCCAIQNFTLFLWESGVGVKWTTGPVTQHPEFDKILDLNPEQEKIVGLIWYGYPAQIPEMKRLDLDLIVKKLP